jgi:hypothetical protein
MSGTITTTILRPAPAPPTSTSVTTSSQRRVQFRDTPESEYTRAINFQSQAQQPQQQSEPIYDEVAGDELPANRPGGNNVRSRRNTSGGSNDDTDDGQIRVGPNGLPYCEEKQGLGARVKTAWARVRSSDDGTRFVFPAIAALVSIVLFVIIVFMTGPALVKIGALALVVAFVVYTYRQCRAVMASLI